jgi:hypothetical protein
MDSFGHKRPINGQTLVKLLAIIERLLAESFPAQKPVLSEIRESKTSISLFFNDCYNGENFAKHCKSAPCGLMLANT